MKFYPLKNYEELYGGVKNYTLNEVIEIIKAK